MRHSTSILFGAVCLLSIASAIPLEARADCPAGSAFYVCQINNFKGCCSIDPCAIKAGCPDKSPSSTSLPPPPPTSSPSAPSASTAAPACTPGTKAFKQFNPTLRTIGASTSDPTLFHIANTTSPKTDISQVFTFTNIPSAATNIGLKWFISQTVPEFSTKGPATGRVYLLDNAKLPSDSQVLTQQAVSSAIETTKDYPTGSVGGAGFGFWDAPDFPKPHDHVISTPMLPARGTLTFSIGIVDQGEVTIRQTQQDGLYLQYDC